MTHQKFAWIAMLTVSLVAALVPTKTEAASIKYRGDTAYISGRLTVEDVYKISELQYRQGLRSVMLNSEGGNLAFAMLMAGAIAIRKLETRVEKGRLCASGCFFLLLAGSPRSVHGNARIGVHSAYTKDLALAEALKKSGFGDENSGNPASVAKMMKEINPDIDSDFLVHLLSKANGAKGEMYWVRQSELRKLGIQIR